MLDYLREEIWIGSYDSFVRENGADYVMRSYVQPAIC
jgi:hypothetical protein